MPPPTKRRTSVLFGLLAIVSMIGPAPYLWRRILDRGHRAVEEPRSYLRGFSTV